MARVNQADARERARAARRRLDAERAERDKKIDEATKDYYEGQALVETGEEQRDAALLLLLDDLAEPIANVALLLDLEPKEIARLRRQAKAANGSADDAQGGQSLGNGTGAEPGAPTGTDDAA